MGITNVIALAALITGAFAVAGLWGNYVAALDRRCDPFTHRPSPAVRRAAWRQAIVMSLTVWVVGTGASALAAVMLGGAS